VVKTNFMLTHRTCFCCRLFQTTGYSGSFKHFLEQEPETIEAVVKTNLLGTLLCSREAARLMLGQQLGGHIFIMDGAGADGSATPQYAAYGKFCDVQIGSLLLFSCLA
jgi:NAD(P)-dependent dehydrogenase (short-subunit alcohol dehydrogenase family)